VPEDAEALLSIYAPYVQNTAVSFEYDVPSAEEFRRRIENTLKFYPYIVALCGGKIIGYAYASSFHSRAAYAWNAELSIYLRTDLHGMGIGSRLYGLIEEVLKAQGIKNLYACIAYSDTPDEYLDSTSPRFHEKRGYKTIARFSKCGFKFSRWYDMIWMEKLIGDHTDDTIDVQPFDKIRYKFDFLSK